MQLTKDMYTKLFFLLVVLALSVSIYAGYEKIVIREEYIVYTNEEQLPAYLTSSADSE